MELAPYRHVIWDWNGTLLNDARLCVATINAVLRQRGLPTITPRRYAERFIFPVRDYYRGLGFDFEKESFEIVGTEFIERYRRRCRSCRLQPHARRVLQALARAGLTQSVLSAHEQATLDQMVDHYGLRRFFVRCVGLDDHYARGKLHTGRRWIRELGHAGREVLLVGDTEHDAEVARALEVDCVLFAGGHNTVARLKACGFPVIRSLRALAGAT